MTPPLVGIATHGRSDRGSFELPCEYVEAIRCAGGLAVLLPPGLEEAEQILCRVDALMLIGGGDVDGTLYGVDAGASLEAVDELRDASELELVRHALSADIPTLGICRGAQVINVALGGTLHPHLPDVFGRSVSHRDESGEATRHAVELDPRSELNSILGTQVCEPVSWHHQCIDALAHGLSPAAWSPDGVLEAFAGSSQHRWLYGVQWHPELTCATDGAQRRLFGALVDAARRRPARGLRR
ncbi:gamma-glutamyl-gamma-aminobutyrate hydrolase family protein [Sorangium sp. So ce1182]|uniref:gamma-glutamyl-gamma-aminobutyrate hydrolase family protein n=1 Tax=Sorangium sp. So ce1182 TaxID=3133334 RepID=UPI003F628CAE